MPTDKRKREHDNPHTAQQQVYSDTSLSQETRKTANK